MSSQTSPAARAQATHFRDTPKEIATPSTMRGRLQMDAPDERSSDEIVGDVLATMPGNRGNGRIGTGQDANLGIIILNIFFILLQWSSKENQACK
jgi:hypothetical protein